MVRKIIPVFITLTFALTGCVSAANDNQQVPASPAQALFEENCGECHGDDGSGSDEAPTVAGHAAEKVREQVRMPEGDMKAVPPEKLSDADLELIAQFVAGLGGGEATRAEELTPSQEERDHLMAAYEAIKDVTNMDRDAAIEHLQQAAALATSDAGEVYEEFIQAIKTKKAGTARHELRELLGLMEMP